jgi:hypothetical protein
MCVSAAHGHETFFVAILACKTSLSWERFFFWFFSHRKYDGIYKIKK